MPSSVAMYSGEWSLRERLRGPGEHSPGAARRSCVRHGCSADPRWLSTREGYATLRMAACCPPASTLCPRPRSPCRSPGPGRSDREGVVYGADLEPRLREPLLLEDAAEALPEERVQRLLRLPRVD